MAMIIFKGWNIGMRGIPFILLLREKTEITLKTAKDIKERIVNNEVITLSIADEKIAAEIAVEARKLGVICEVVA